MQQFKKGWYEMVLLCIISRGETYGYEMITRLNADPGGVFSGAREGTVYPILYRLEDSGLIAARMAASPKNGGMKKYYSITPAGRELLGALVGFWGDFSRSVGGFAAAAVTDKEENDG